jgi:hypothetical protein
MCGSLVADLDEKVKRYERLLKEGLEKSEIAPIGESHMYKVAGDFRSMAESYYNDGVHFISIEDPVNALVCFSYGHAWLDAGAKLGIFNVDDETLFTI